MCLQKRNITNMNYNFFLLKIKAVKRLSSNTSNHKNNNFRIKPSNLIILQFNKPSEKEEGKKNNYSLLGRIVREEGSTVESQQTKGEEVCESYLPCNGVCLPRRSQSLLASNKSKTSKSKTDHHKKRKKMKYIFFKKREAAMIHLSSHTPAEWCQHTHVVDHTLLTANNCSPHLFAIEIQLSTFICVSPLFYLLLSYGLKSRLYYWGCLRHL